MRTPKFKIWDRVKFLYWSWSRTDGKDEIEATVVGIDTAAQFGPLPDGLDIGYMLKVNPGDLDSTDRGGLEGPNRDEYWHIRERALTLVG